jgi:CheY-like chemotaxis protein
MPQFMMLLMEDHPMQREIFVELLKGEGFEVVQCTTAEAAELVIAISGLEFRAVVADQNLDGDMLGPADCGARDDRRLCYCSSTGGCSLGVTVAPALLAA